LADRANHLNVERRRGGITSLLATHDPRFSKGKYADSDNGDQIPIGTAVASQIHVVTV